MNGKYSLVCILVLLAATLLAGCGVPGTQRNPASISVEDATNLLRQAEAFAKAHDQQGLCGMGGSVATCKAFLDDVGGWESVPDESPTIVNSYILPATRSGNVGTAGGRILVLEGVDNLGRRYRNEFMVFYEGNRLISVNPVYWSSVGIQQPDANGGGTTR